MPVRSLSLFNLVAIWFETLLYGVYVVFVVPTFYVVLYRPLSNSPSTRKINQTYLAGVFALFMFSTVHVASGLAMLLEAFVSFPGLSSESYFARIFSPLNILRATSLLASIALAGVLMIHRVYVLWNRSLIMILAPLINLVLAMASGIIVLTLTSQVANGPLLSPSSSVSIELSASLTPTLRILLPIHAAMLFVANLWITILAVSRVCMEGIILDQKRWSRKRKLVTTIGESGAMYTLTSLVAFFLTLVGANSQIIPYTALAPLAAISPTLMILTAECGYPTSPSNSPLCCSPQFCFQVPKRPSIAPSEKGLATISPPPTPAAYTISKSPDRSQSSSAQGGHLKPTNEPDLNTEPATPVPLTQLPLLSVKLKNARVPPVPITPPLVPLIKRRANDISLSPLKPTYDQGLDSPPPAPHTPTPQTNFPSPFETHFPRNGRHERISQQTFNPGREGAGKGGTAYTTFGESSLARLLAQAKDGDDKSRAPSLGTSGGLPGALNSQDKERKERGKKPGIVVPDPLPGVYMTKAVERRIDYIAEETS